jgi:Zn-dependent M28 family amino/carboxypeptidase
MQLVLFVFFSVCQVVVVGAHLDSWDVGQGAHDDGQGCMIAWEVVRLLKQLGMNALVNRAFSVTIVILDE